jgi:hypothetical protein
MDIVLLWTIMAYGITNILVYGSIFSGLRMKIKEWGENEFAPFQNIGEFLNGIISCVMCCSTWVGFFLGVVIYSPTHEFLNTSLIWSWFFDGLFASGGVWAINAIIEWFELNRPKTD